MSSKLVSSIALTACLLASGGAFAEVLYQQAPTADATGESANNPVVTGEPFSTAVTIGPTSMPPSSAFIAPTSARSRSRELLVSACSRGRTMELSAATTMRAKARRALGGSSLRCSIRAWTGLRRPMSCFQNVNARSGCSCRSALIRRKSPGSSVLDATNAKDYALMQGVFLIITLSVLFANIAADVAYAFLDPRTRQTEA